MSRVLTPLRASRDRTEVEGWALVLAAAAIPYRIDKPHGLWELSVDQADAQRSNEQLELYERENTGRVEADLPAPRYGRTIGGVVVGLSLCLFFALTGPYHRASRWHLGGAADADALLDGEVWRAVTALTLHSDLPHVLANAASSAVFVTFVFHSVGPGVGGCLILLAGFGGNALNAWISGPGHVSVGASTAIFGAIGILSGLQFARRWRLGIHRRAAWLPLAAGLGLLAMLGTAGDRTDVSAHVLGLICGVPLGALVAVALARPPGAAVQWSAVFAALALIASAWRLALGA